jgi:Uma2 family endonuclease
MTISEAWPEFGDAFSVAELDRMPDDGHRYELLDGALVVSPRPTMIHQIVTTRLASVLDRNCPEDLCVAVEPAVQLDKRTEFDPDVVVVPLDQGSVAKLLAPPLLVVEVRSPSTALFDLNRKKAAYQEFSVPSYWIVDPDPERPELTVFELRDGSYVTEATSTQPVTVTRPFPVTIIPAKLTRGLRR